MASKGDGTVPGKVDGRGSGWNDPPASRYSSSPRGGGLSQKRVPFLLHADCTPSINCGLLNPTETSPSTTSASPAAVSPRVQLFPPLHGTDLSTYTAPLIIPTLSSSGADGSLAMNPVTAVSIAVKTSEFDADVPEFEDDEQMFHYVITRLQRALNDCQSATADLRAADEMHKKVNVFSDMWKNGKISYPVKSTMAQLATAIHKRQCVMAQELLMSLMVGDHVSEVSRWLVGVKRLVQEVRNVEAPLSPSSDCHVLPSLRDTTQSVTVVANCDDIQLTDNCHSSLAVVTSSQSTHFVTLNRGNAADTLPQKSSADSCTDVSGAPLVTSQLTSFVGSENLSPTVTDDYNISGHIEATSSQDDYSMSTMCETQPPPVSTSADTVDS